MSKKDRPVLISEDAYQRLKEIKKLYDIDHKAFIRLAIHKLANHVEEHGVKRLIK